MLACQHQYCYHKKIEQDTEEEVGDASGHLKPSLIFAELLDAPVHNTSNGQLRGVVIFFWCPALSTRFTLKINWIYIYYVEADYSPLCKCL